MSNKKKTVLVGMSGGVDSSVSAYMLKQAGYEVIGVFIKVWQPEGFPCTAKEDRLDAMRVAAQLDIPLITLDLEKEYKEGVIDYMLQEYKNGNTPNPDVMCNKEVKFGAFLRFARARGADYVATGHYAQVVHDMNESKMITSKDTEKDQTYFLWTLTQEQIQHVLFPIGHLEKSEVRTIAEKQNLYTAPKKDSQGLCFVGDVSFKELLKQELAPVSGNVLDEAGNIIGTHDGAMLYTVGERHGFTITHKTNHDEKMYVISRDMTHNTITVSANKPDVHAEHTTKNIYLRDVSYTRAPFQVGERLDVRLRYRAKTVSCVVQKVSDNMLECELAEPLLATPGQSAVFYSGAEMRGGGILM